MSASRPLNCDGKDNNKKNGSSEFTVSYSHISYSILQSYFHIVQFAERMAYEVFLGGSCNPTTWRSEIAIPTLQSLGITYYNPVCISSHNQFSTASFSYMNRQSNSRNLLAFYVMRFSKYRNGGQN